MPEIEAIQESIPEIIPESIQRASEISPESSEAILQHLEMISLTLRYLLTLQMITVSIVTAIGFVYFLYCIYRDYMDATYPPCNMHDYD